MTDEVKTLKTPRRRRSSLKRQRMALIICAAAVAVLVVAFIFVWRFTSRTLFRDHDGTKYYILQKDGEYVMQDADGNAVHMTSDGNYETAAGTIVMVNYETGEFEVIAAVATSGTETVAFDSYVGRFDVLLYPMLERAEIASIEVCNTEDHFRFVRNADDNFEIEGHPGIPYSSTMFATLVVCTGYTRTLMRLDQQKVYEYGFDEYGIPDNPDDAQTYFVITATDGTSHKVVVGNQAPAGTGYYARYVGRDEIYLLKQLEESENNATFSQIIFAHVEDYVTPTVAVPMTSGNYFDVSNFTLYTAPDLTVLDETEFTRVIEFSYEPIELRRGTFRSNLPYVGVDVLEGYTINTYRADDCLQNIWNMAPIRTVWLNQPSKPLDVTAFVSTYGLGYAIEYTFNNARNGEDKGYSVPENEKYYQQIWISPVTEKGTYYLYNEMFEMVVEVSRSDLEYLEWSTFYWVNSDVFSGSIAYVTDVSVSVKGGTAAGLTGITEAHFTLDNSKSLAGENTTDSAGNISSALLEVFADYTENGATHTGVQVDTTQFKRFYQTLIYSSLEGSASLTEAQMEEFRASGDEGADAIIRITYHTDSGDVERVYRFYAYGSRQSFVTVGGKGSFYMLRNRVTKIANDVGRIFTPTTEIDPQAKN